MEDYLQTGKSHTAFFQDLFLRTAKSKGDHLPIVNSDTGALIEIIVSIYKDYKSAVDTLMESIDLLAQEVASLQAAPPCPGTHTPIPLPLTDTRVPGTTAGPSTQPARILSRSSLKPLGLQLLEKGVRNVMPIELVRHPHSPRPQPPPNSCSQRGVSQPENATSSLNGRVAPLTRPS